MPGLQVTQILAFQEVEILSHCYREKSVVLSAIKKSKFEVCPKCATQSESVYDHRNVKVRDEPLGNRLVVFDLKKRRFWCKKCEKPFTELNIEQQLIPELMNLTCCGLRKGETPASFIKIAEKTQAKGYFDFAINQQFISNSGENTTFSAFFRCLIRTNNFGKFINEIRSLAIPTFYYDNTRFPFSDEVI